MSGNSQTASAIAGWPATAPAIAPPHSSGAVAAVRGPVTAALFWARRLREALKGMFPRPTGGDGGPETPEEGSDSGSIWDDPALWTLMMH